VQGVWLKPDSLLRPVILPKVKRPSERRADPYRDLDVIDSRGPRFNQVVIGSLALVAVVAGWPWLLGLLALQLVVGLTFGRRYCLPCLAYFELSSRTSAKGRSRMRGLLASRTSSGRSSSGRRTSRTSPGSLHSQPPSASSSPRSRSSRRQPGSVPDARRTRSATCSPAAGSSRARCHRVPHRPRTSSSRGLRVTTSS
jgi:Domain of unknown function (DUF4395)